MDPNDYSVSVWKDCEKCSGSGQQKNVLIDGVFWEDCKHCKGYGKRPTFIPLSEVILAVSKHQGVFVGSQTDTVAALNQWLLRQEEASGAESP